MCSSQFIDKIKGKTGSGTGGGVSTGGGSGPSAGLATRAMAARQKAGAPYLDDMFGVKNG